MTVIIAVVNLSRVVSYLQLQLLGFCQHPVSKRPDELEQLQRVLACCHLLCNPQHDINKLHACTFTTDVPAQLENPISTDVQ